MLSAEPNHTPYWVGFNLVKGIGSARMRALLEYFGDAQTAWNASRSEMEEAGLSSKLIDAIEQMRSSDLPECTWQTIQEQSINVLTWEDPAYPRRLKEIDQPPPVLYLHGNLVEEDQWCVAIVGTRQMTAYGRQITEEIASDLARAGIVIVSGLARGIDGIAHQAALDSGGRTLAVLGSGVDQVYPPEHRKLAARIIQNGALISDYPPGTAPEAVNFPPRNRIISGLAQAVAVIEAGVKSGALITAAFAAEQGRPVFAVPGQIHAPKSKGTNLLLREGASLLLDAQDILEALNLERVNLHRSARTVLPADATEAQIYTLLGREPLYVDEIHLQADLPVEKVSAVLTLMELKGMVRQVGPMRYVAVCEPDEDYDTEEPETEYAEK